MHYTRIKVLLRGNLDDMYWPMDLYKSCMCICRYFVYAWVSGFIHLHYRSYTNVRSLSQNHIHEYVYISQCFSCLSFRVMCLSFVLLSVCLFFFQVNSLVSFLFLNPNIIILLSICLTLWLFVVYVLRTWEISTLLPLPLLYLSFTPFTTFSLCSSLSHINIYIICVFVHYKIPF